MILKKCDNCKKRFRCLTMGGYYVVRDYVGARERVYQEAHQEETVIVFFKSASTPAEDEYDEYLWPDYDYAMHVAERASNNFAGQYSYRVEKATLCAPYRFVK